MKETDSDSLAEKENTKHKKYNRKAKYRWINLYKLSSHWLFGMENSRLVLVTFITVTTCYNDEFFIDLLKFCLVY